MVWLYIALSVVTVLINTLSIWLTYPILASVNDSRLREVIETYLAEIDIFVHVVGFIATCIPLFAIVVVFFVIFLDEAKVRKPSDEAKVRNLIDIIMVSLLIGVGLVGVIGITVFTESFINIQAYRNNLQVSQFTQLNLFLGVVRWPPPESPMTIMRYIIFVLTLGSGFLLYLHGRKRTIQ